MANMPTLYQDKQSGKWHVFFRIYIDGKNLQIHKSLKTKNELEAQVLCAKIHETIEDIEKGNSPAPSKDALWTFLITGGKINGNGKHVIKKKLTLMEMFEKYEAELPPDHLEPNSLNNKQIHKRHFCRIFGDNAEVSSLSLKQYIAARGKEKWHDKSIKACTIKKEIATLRSVCKWAAHENQGYLDKSPNFTQLAYAKSESKPPFMTWAEIEQKIARGGSKKLWECLFLDTQQIDECLEFVRKTAAEPFVYPMFMLVAKTGIRRSEMIRIKTEDFIDQLGDISKNGNAREKKRNRTMKETFRRIILPDSVVCALRDWLKVHPGGPHLFCMTTTLKEMSTGQMTGKIRTEPEQMKPNLAWYYFKKTLAGSKWEVLKGYHIFRHSFASNLAAAGVDQREIDALMGHQTEAMRKRYQHLFPKKLEDAVFSVYK